MELMGIHFLTYCNYVYIYIYMCVFTVFLFDSFKLGCVFGRLQLRSLRGLYRNMGAASLHSPDCLVAGKREFMLVCSRARA